MNAKELRELLKKYNLGNLVLEKEEGGYDVHPIVVDDSGKIIPGRDTHVFHNIDIDDSTFGYTTTEDICEQDYEDYEISSIFFHSTNWAYPSASYYCGGSVESEMGIRITNKELEYTEQAIKAITRPTEYQIWLLEMYLSEYKTLNSRLGELLKRAGFYQESNEIYLKNGFTEEYSSTPYLVFKTLGPTELYINQNLFTGKFEFDDGIEINSIDPEEFKKWIEHKFEKNSEWYVRKFNEWYKEGEDEFGIYRRGSSRECSAIYNQFEKETGIDITYKEEI